ncbi:MAG: glycosyltransferase [Prevotella sp.]|nr:glycosyltransferase [Prevotella sp.]
MSETPHSIASGAPSVSIVLAVHDQAEQLERNLPLLLACDYEPGYEVIVVDESSTDSTEEVLKQLKAQHPRLYTTYIPASSHYVSRRKLALTIGIKAAKNEWVIVTEAGCHPEGDAWLSDLGETLAQADADVLCAYTPYDEGVGGLRAFLRMQTFWRQGSRPYRYDGACLALRKSAFMQRNGFLHNLQFLRGEYDFIVNETEPGRVATLNNPDNCLRQEELPKKEWVARQMHYMQHRSHLGHAFVQRLCFVLHQLLLHLLYLGTIAATAWFFLTENMVPGTVCAAFLLVLIGCHTAVCRMLVRRYGEHIGWWKLPWLDLAVAWHRLWYRLRYALTDKYDYIRK